MMSSTTCPPRAAVPPDHLTGRLRQRPTSTHHCAAPRHPDRLFAWAKSRQYNSISVVQAVYQPRTAHAPVTCFTYSKGSYELLHLEFASVRCLAPPAPRGILCNPG